MFEIFEGSNKNPVTTLNQLLLFGGELTIYLNGGSDTRKSAREYWKEVADFHSLGFKKDGCSVTLTRKPDKERQAYFLLSRTPKFKETLEKQQKWSYMQKGQMFG